MKFPKLMLGEISPGVIGVFSTPQGGISPHYFAVIPREVTGAEPWIQLLLASPDLLNAAENLLEYVDPYKANDNAYTMAVLDMKRACQFARRELNLETLLWREHAFHETAEKLSADFGQPVQRVNKEVFCDPQQTVGPPPGKYRAPDDGSVKRAVEFMENMGKMSNAEIDLSALAKLTDELMPKEESGAERLGKRLGRLFRKFW